MDFFPLNRIRKKADLNLSINAIVVLILAITMLALGLGFIRNMFGKGIDSTLKNLDKLETDRMNNLLNDCNDEVCVEKLQMQIKKGERQSLIAIINNRYPCDIDPVKLYVAKKDATHQGGSTSAKFIVTDCDFIGGTTPDPACQDISITSMKTASVTKGSKQWVKFNIQPAANSAMTQYRYNLIFDGVCSTDTNMKIDRIVPIEIEVTG